MSDGSLNKVKTRKEVPMAPEMLGGFLMASATRRVWRQFQHRVRRAEKKEAKRLRAGRAAVRMRNMQPFMRSIASGPTLFLEIKVGNDLEIYEPEVVRFAREEVEEINLFYDFYGVLDEEDYDWLSLHDNFRS